MSKKILYSPGFGAGWSTWNGGKVAKFMLTYQPIIDFLENGGKFTDADCHEDNYSSGKRETKVLHPLLQQLQTEVKEKFGESHVCVLGADDLRVTIVSGPFKVDEYDGSESIIGQHEDIWIDPDDLNGQD